MLQRESLAMMPDYCADLLERTGIDPQYRRDGALELIFEDQRHRMALSEQRAAEADNLCMPDGQLWWEVLSPYDAAAVEPQINPACRSALLCRYAAQLRTPRLLKALVAACRGGGVDIREQTSVTGLVVESGRVLGVHTAAGSVHAGCVVVAAGAWSAWVDPVLAAPVPTRPVKGQVLLLETDCLQHARFKHIVLRRRCYLVRRNDGLVIVGATVEEDGGFDRRNTAAAISELLSKAQSLVPALAEAGVLGCWSGLRPGTPDRRPIIGPVPGLEQLVVATGHYRTGIALAPVTAEITHDLIRNGCSRRDLSFCRPGRFS